MKREIKFRAWDTEKARWCEKELLLDYEGEWMSRYGEHGVEIVFQFFTGLKDKNGREIYEGDILQVPNNLGRGALAHPFSVEYKDAAFKGHLHGDKEANLILTQFGTGMDEIIGNIYENPELLSRSI